MRVVPKEIRPGSEIFTGLNTSFNVRIGYEIKPSDEKYKKNNIRTRKSVFIDEIL